MFSAVSIVWDREFGFLREMLVAPVRRGAIIVGKCLGGATVATIQGALMLALAGLVHVPYSPMLLGGAARRDGCWPRSCSPLRHAPGRADQQVESFRP